MQYFIISRFFDELHKRVIVRLFHFLTVEIGLYNIDHLFTYSFLYLTDLKLFVLKVIPWPSFFVVCEINRGAIGKSGRIIFKNRNIKEQ